MMKTYSFGYGETAVELDFTGAGSLRVLQGESLPAADDYRAMFLRSVGPESIGSPPLCELVCARDEVTVVISDITRFWMRQDLVCEQLVGYLHEALGMPYENMVIVVALGTHRPQTAEELKKLVTPGVYEKVRVLNHDCTAPDLQYLGTTSRGTEVWVNALAVGRKLILVSGTIHHLMAGYSGGRKSILPGISGKKTIYQNHVHSLAPDLPKSNPLIGMGTLLHNPVNEDMNEAAALVAPTYGINVVMDSQTGNSRLLCGHYEKAWEESCRLVQRMMGIPIEKKADIVVVSCGGYPKDINLYQAVKALINAAEALKDGGQLIFLAECREGGGAPDYFDWIIPLRRGTLDPDLRKGFTIAGYIFYASCEVMAKGETLMLTAIPPETLEGMGAKVFSSAGELLKNVSFTGKDVYLMPYGGYTVPYLSGNKSET